MRPWIVLTALVALAPSLPVALGGVITIDFEGLSDGTVLSSQFPGLQFTNASVWTAGLSLNELEFPPHSGVNVAADVGGPVMIVFTTPVLNVSAFFTYSSVLTLDAFNATNQAVGTTTSAFSANFVSSGHSPNELLQISYAGGISSVTFTSAPNSSFVFDDLTIGTATSTATPEPALGPLVLIGLVYIGVRRARSRQPTPGRVI